jgi:hypothetical protein
LVEKHYVSKRSRSQKGVLAFLAHDADTRVFWVAVDSVKVAFPRFAELSKKRLWTRSSN